MRASTYSLQALAAPPLAPGIVYTIPVKLVNQGLPSDGNLYGAAPTLENVTLSQPPVLDWIIVKPTHFSNVAENEEVDFELEVHVPQWLAEGKYSDAVIITASGGITTALKINAEMKGDGLHIETQYVTPLVPDLNNLPSGDGTGGGGTVGGEDPNNPPWWQSVLPQLYPTESEPLRMDWAIERTCCRNCPHDPVYFWGWFGGYFAQVVGGGGPSYAPEFKHGLVYLEINQRISLEREAFIATMVLDHGGGEPIDAITSTITVNDGSGASWVVAPGEGPGFVIQPIVPTALGGLTPGESRVASWTLIPDDLGITEPDGRNYTVQAHLSYLIDGVLYTLHTQPVPITVKPQPKVVLDYYIPTTCMQTNHSNCM